MSARSSHPKLAKIHPFTTIPCVVAWLTSDSNNKPLYFLVLHLRFAPKTVMPDAMVCDLLVCSISIINLIVVSIAAIVDFACITFSLHCPVIRFFSPNQETKRQGDKETKRQRDKETKRQRDKETKRQERNILPFT
ncbi:hypothetical protein F5H01DRAFT_326221 [Linnemannia elongata]|nr:hypothetical protein F5H01DRAFT_326221 [Linnemannia elongata]